MAQDYLPSPSRAKFDHLYSLAATVIKCLDLSEVPPAARLKGGPSAASALYDTLSRIQLPPFDQIPDAAQMSKLSGAAAERWEVPNTEIVIERMKSGPRSGEFLFSAWDCRPGGGVLRTGARVALYAACPSGAFQGNNNQPGGLDDSVCLDQSASSVASRPDCRASALEVDRLLPPPGLRCALVTADISPVSTGQRRAAAPPGVAALVVAAFFSAGHAGCHLPRSRANQPD